MTVLHGLRRGDTGAALRIQRGTVRRWQRDYVRRVLGADLAAAAVAAGAAWLVRYPESPAATQVHALLTAVLPVAWVATAAFLRAYEARFLGTGPEEFRRVVTTAAALMIAIAVVSYATRTEVARGYVLVAVPAAMLLSLLGRHAARRWLLRRRLAGECLHRVVIVGHESAVRSWAEHLQRETAAGMRVVGACLPAAPREPGLSGTRVPHLGGFGDVPAAVREVGADTVAVLACPELDGPALRRLAWQLEPVGTDLVIAPAALDVAGPRIHIRPVSGMPLLHLEQPELTGGRQVLKGVVDRGLAAVAVVLLAPVLLAVALAVRLSGPGPVLFRQRRVGRDGHEFTMLKFRTMGAGAEAGRQRLLASNEADGGVLFKLRSDPRVTPLGAWLRRFSLDELPQLLNVLTGSMSLVGPRPPLASEVAMYDDDMRARRMLVKPGVTGLWQISGRADLPWDEAVRLDLRYVENWSLALDFSILARTLSAVVRGSGAY